MALRFASDHGENIFLPTNLEAEWRTSYSGGLCFSEGPIGKDPLRMRIYGSSHVVIGYLEKNPSKLRISEVLNQIKRTSDVRVHKSTFKVSMRLSSDGRHLVLDSDNKRSERFGVGKGHVWLSVYIQFGSASICLGKILFCIQALMKTEGTIKNNLDPTKTTGDEFSCSQGWAVTPWKTGMKSVVHNGEQWPKIKTGDEISCSQGWAVTPSNERGMNWVVHKGEQWPTKIKRGINSVVPKGEQWSHEQNRGWTQLFPRMSSDSIKKAWD